MAQYYVLQNVSMNHSQWWEPHGEKMPPCCSRCLKWLWQWWGGMAYMAHWSAMQNLVLCILGIQLQPGQPWYLCHQHPDTFNIFKISKETNPFLLQFVTMSLSLKILEIIILQHGTAEHQEQQLSKWTIHLIFKSRVDTNMVLFLPRYWHSASALIYLRLLT